MSKDQDQTSDLRHFCIQAIENDPESAKMATIGHERGFVYLIDLVQRTMPEPPAVNVIREALKRCLKRK